MNITGKRKMENAKTAMFSSSVEFILELASEDFLVTVGVVAYIEVCGQELHPGIWWILPRPHVMSWAWFARWSTECFGDDAFLIRATFLGLTLELYWYGDKEDVREA